MKKDIFTTQGGAEIELIAIPPFEIQMVADALKERHPIPSVPTYEVETVGGGKEFHAHTADTATEPVDRAKWEEYIKIKTISESAINQGMNDYLFMAGTRSAVSNDDGWQKLQKRFGVVIPDDPDELRLHYLKTRLLSPDDITELLPRLMAKTGADPKLVESAKNSFRRAVRRQSGTNNRSTNVEETGQVVDDGEIPGDQDGESVGEDAG